MKEGNGEDPDRTPPDGVVGTVHRHDSDITGLKGTVQTIANEVHEMRGDLAEVKGVVMRLDSSRSVPPMRAELPSSMSPVELKAELRQAAREGEKDPTTTAEARVEAVLERVELIRRGRLFNKLIWLALSGAAGFAADRIINALGHH